MQCSEIKLVKGLTEDGKAEFETGGGTRIFARFRPRKPLPKV